MFLFLYSNCVFNSIQFVLWFVSMSSPVKSFSLVLACSAFLKPWQLRTCSAKSHAQSKDNGPSRPMPSRVVTQFLARTHTRFSHGLTCFSQAFSDILSIFFCILLSCVIDSIHIIHAAPFSWHISTTSTFCKVKPSGRHRDLSSSEANESAALLWHFFRIYKGQSQSTRREDRVSRARL